MEEKGDHMKKMSALILALVLVFTLVACSSANDNAANGTPSSSPSGNSDATYTIRLAHAVAENTPAHQAAVNFGKKVEEQTNGDVKVEVYPNGTLGGNTDSAEMLQANTLQAALIPTATLCTSYAPLQVLDLPFLFTDREVAYQIFDSEEFMDLFVPDLRDLDLEFVALWESGFKQFTSNNKITSPDDFNGLTFRIMESPLLRVQYQTLGANPVGIDFSELYNALQQGVCDGEENPLVSIVSSKFYEVQTNVTLSNHGYLPYAFLFSKTFWQGLPEEYQDIIHKAAVEGAAENRQLTAAAEEGYIKTIEDSGTEVYVLSPEEIEVFVEVMKPVHEEFRDVIGSDILDAVYGLIDQYSAG